MMKGVNATELTLEYLNCDAVQMLIKCPATISSGAAYFDKFADCPLLCQYGEIGGLPSGGDYMLKPENYLAVQDAFKGGMVIQHMETTLDQTRYTNPDEADALWKSIREDHKIRWDTRVVRCWYFLTLTYNESLKRTNIGRSLLAWNELFRGQSFAMDYLKTIGENVVRDSIGHAMHSDRIIEIPESVDVTKVIGIVEPGPVKQSTPQRLIAMHDISREANYNSIITISKESPVALKDIWSWYYNMFAKQAVWSSQFLFSFYMAPDYPPWETHPGDQGGYNPVSDYITDESHVERFPWTTTDGHGVETTQDLPYLMPTKWLATQTFNHSDYLVSGGDFVLNGSGMYLINKVIPKTDLEWYKAQTKLFKDVFDKQNTDKGWNYSGVMAKNPLLHSSR